VVDTVPQIESEQTPAAVSEAPKSASFFATTTGKTVIAVIAVFVLLIVSGVAAFLFFMRGDGTTPQPAVTPPAVVSPNQQGETEQPVDPAEKPLSSTFVFRNIFAPSVKAPAPPKEETASDGTGDTDSDGSDGSGTTAGSNELLLVSIQTNDGERTATLSWEGESFVLAEGEAIPGTPWKVVDIGTDSVSVIFGDSSPIELTVGSSVTK